MKQIKILGTGCSKCKQTEAIVKQVVAQMGIEATIEKVEEIEKIMEYNVLTTPALVIDGQIMVKGRVPGAEEVKTFLQ